MCAPWVWFWASNTTFCVKEDHGFDSSVGANPALTGGQKSQTWDLLWVTGGPLETIFVKKIFKSRVKKFCPSLPATLFHFFYQASKGKIFSHKFWKKVLPKIVSWGPPVTHTKSQVWDFCAQKLVQGSGVTIEVGSKSFLLKNIPLMSLLQFYYFFKRELTLLSLLHL